MFWFSVFLIVLILIFANALYVAAEFATVSSRRSRLSQLASEGHSHALKLLEIVEDVHKLDAYVATCQVGITISSLILGFYSQSQIAAAVIPLLSRLGPVTESVAQSIGATVVLLFLTILQILLGELVPKNIAIQYPERLALYLILPMRWSIALFAPLIWLFNGSGHLLMRLFHMKPLSEHAHVHSPEEITMLIDESGAGGMLEKEEYRLLRNTLQMHDSLVRQVMLPRTRMLAAPADTACQELLTMLAESSYSRLPLYEESTDNIVGAVDLRGLLCLPPLACADDAQAIMHPVQYIPETMRAREALTLLQGQHLHLAVVLDEFGGTAGIVTIGDLLEEIFGEMQDEFDVSVTPAIQVSSGNWIWIRGDTPIEDVVMRLGLQLPDMEDIDTIGGLVLDAFGHVPKVNDEIEIAGYWFRVVKMIGLWVSVVGLAASPAQIDHLKARTP
jgi:putative hemolysin